jgi:hypothetical protein
MMHSRIFILSALAVGSALSTSAEAQTLDGAYRGTIVCEKIKATPDMLRAPLDLAVRGGNVAFARPTFNLDGTRVTGSELGTGTVDNDGKIHLTSAWFRAGVSLQADYSGTLTAAGGTLSGKQSWRGPQDNTGSRNCTAALVPAPKVEQPIEHQVEQQ